MAGPGRRCCSAWAAWLWVLGLWAMLNPLVQAAPLELRQAQVQITVDGQSSHAAVKLPYPWDVHHKGQQGEAVFDLHFEVAQLPHEPWAMYFPRVGTAYEVRLNGRLLDRKGDTTRPNGPDFGLVPRYLNIPEGVLTLDNHLQVKIRADTGRRGGLSVLSVGPADEVYPLYRQEFLLRNTGALVVVGFSLVVGLVSMALWATQNHATTLGVPQRDPLYLYAGLAELAWTLRVGHTLIEAPLFDWPWWGILPVASLGAWGVCMTCFCLELAGVRRGPLVRWYRRWLMLLMLLGPLVGFVALGLSQPWVLTLWYAALGVSFLLFGAWFLGRAVRTPSWLLRGVCLAVLINVAMGLRDLYVFRIGPAYPSNSAMYYASMLFGLSLGYVVLARFKSASLQAQQLMSSLASRVAERERELNSSYQRLELLAREQERTAERSRILRDMHDGVGSHLSAAIRQLQSGRARPEDVLQTLRDSLDQLKLNIDAMHLPAGDVTALLANLRYRLEPRFSASDVELQWDVDLIEPIQRLDGAAMRQLQFMLFEALSNVLQHAQASWLCIEARQTPEGVCVRIIDNGRGFDASAVPRRGLLFLRERAQALGARLHIDSAPGRTAVSILMPLA